MSFFSVGLILFSVGLRFVWWLKVYHVYSRFADWFDISVRFDFKSETYGRVWLKIRWFRVSLGLV